MSIEHPAGWPGLRRAAACWKLLVNACAAACMSWFSTQKHADPHSSAGPHSSDEMHLRCMSSHRIVPQGTHPQSLSNQQVRPARVALSTLFGVNAKRYKPSVSEINRSATTPSSVARAPPPPRRATATTTSCEQQPTRGGIAICAPANGTSGRGWSANGTMSARSGHVGEVIWRNSQWNHESDSDS